MRQFSITVLIIFLLAGNVIQPSFAAVKGGISYEIPTDYSKLSESELKMRADKYFYNASRINDGEINDDMTNALMLYSVLRNINPENPLYSVRLGILYGKLKKDRYAKGGFSRAIGIDSSNAEAYFYFGEFYYKRQLYRKALKMYKESYAKGYSEQYELNYRLGDIYEKLGDTKNALLYLEKANTKNPNPELSNKIKRVKTFDSMNKPYYSK